tara:strand:+ start:176 stop:622 length:447 start_codon:yes stop_codon:yes gene_type:complete
MSLDNLKTGIDGLSGIVNEARTGNSNPEQLADRIVGDVFIPWYGDGSKQEELSALTEGEQNAIMDNVRQLNAFYKSVREQNQPEALYLAQEVKMLEGLTQTVNAITGTLATGKAMGIAGQDNWQPSNRDKKGLYVSHAIEKLGESYRP